jgi:hypothetical protein
VTLLRDIRAIFKAQSGKDADKIFSIDLASTLRDTEGSPWADWDRGKVLTTNALAKRLKCFRVYLQSVRMGIKTGKGYMRDVFTEHWERYLPLTAVTSIWGQDESWRFIEGRSEMQASKILHSIESAGGALWVTGKSLG